MKNIQIELLKLIVENDNPEEALLIALDIITSLKQSEAYQEPSAVSLQEFDLLNQAPCEPMADLTQESA